MTHPNPIYGIRHENITSKITRHNWHKKAILRCCKGGWAYLWIDKEYYDEVDSDGKDIRSLLYVVNAAHNADAEVSIDDIRSDFSKLIDAVSYINGKGNTVLANKTWLPKSQKEYPIEGSFPDCYEIFYNDEWFDPIAEKGRNYYLQKSDEEAQFYNTVGAAGMTLPLRYTKKKSVK
jgi:hypothetical protein